MNWYEEMIEPGIREVVRLMRDNGFNTECSCEHEMFVQFQVMKDSNEIDRLDNLLFNSGMRDYRIDLELRREQGFISTFATVYFQDAKGNYPAHDRKTAALEQFLSREAES